MKTSRTERIVKGPAVKVGSVRVAPIMRCSRQTTATSNSIVFWSVHPIGIQVLTETADYTLDLTGQRSEELEELWS